MTTPDDLHIHLPRSLEEIVSTTPDSGARRWVEMSGGGLPGRVAVGVDRTEDGRFIVTGLLIGHRGHDELGWQHLRGIRPATLLSWIFDGFDPLQPAAMARETLAGSVEILDGTEFDQEAWERDDEATPLQSPGQAWRDLRKQAPYALWTAVSGQPSGQPREESRATAGATDLEEFAKVYQRHFALTPTKATAATAKEYAVSRATVIRRLAAARSVGLLPPADPRLGGRPKKDPR